jgi:hypothetical protein
MRSQSAKVTATTLIVAGALLSVSIVGAAAQTGGSSQSAPVGKTLEKNRQTIASALRVDLTRDFATLPLHRGTAKGETVWFVVTDVSNARIARTLGVNHAPKLANAGRGCPACVQEVSTSNPLLGRAPVRFQGAPDFSPKRTVIAGPPRHPFPPQAFSVGAMARANYSPFVTVRGSSVVYNAPIVATGNGPFDVKAHTNTHDRTLGIDTKRMTTDHLFVRGFSNGKSIFYLSFDSSDAFTATIERSTFVPGLADLPFQNGGGRPTSARSAIFTFVNAKAGLERPSARGASQGRGRNQGLTHALSLPIAGHDAAVANPGVLRTLARGADVSNIFDVFPTNARARDRREYSPAWDLQVGVYSKAAVARGLNGLKTDANTVRRLAARGLVTAPGGEPLGSANIVINCPALAFFDTNPQGPRMPVRGVRP